jgi:hypothetical protein
MRKIFPFSLVSDWVTARLLKGKATGLDLWLMDRGF